MTGKDSQIASAKEEYAEQLKKKNQEISELQKEIE